MIFIYVYKCSLIFLRKSKKELYMKTNVKIYFLLQCMLMVLSLSGVCSKKASNESFLSFEFCVFYALVIIILGIYAIVWQQIIKRMDLTIAFANKSIGIVWGMIWGKVIFHEIITVKMFIGAIIVIVGAIMYSFADEFYYKGKQNKRADENITDTMLTCNEKTSEGGAYDGR